MTATNPGLVSARGGGRTPPLLCCGGGGGQSSAKASQLRPSLGICQATALRSGLSAWAHANQQTPQGEGEADQGFGDLHFATLCGSRPRSHCWRRRLNPARGPGPFVPLALSAQGRYHSPLQMASNFSWLCWSSCRAVRPTHTNSSLHPCVPREGVKASVTLQAVGLSPAPCCPGRTPESPGERASPQGWLWGWLPKESIAP